MTTANDLITEALQIVGVLAGGETLNGNDADSCLFTLNAMMDSWNTERLAIYTVQESVVPSFSGASLTIGPGGTLDVPRPVVLEDTCFSRFLGVDYPMARINGEQWSAIRLKTISSTFPTVVYWDGNAPIGTAYFWPQPSQAVALHLRMQQQLSEFDDLTTDYTIPQGYRLAISYSLAEHLAIKFTRPLDGSVIRMAAKARRNIKRVNGPTQILCTPANLQTGKGRFNIYSGLNGS